MKGCVVIIAARCEGEEIFARFGRAVAKELNLDIAQRCVQGDRHAAGGAEPRGETCVVRLMRQLFRARLLCSPPLPLLTPSLRLVNTLQFLSVEVRGTRTSEPRGSGGYRSQPTGPWDHPANTPQRRRAEQEVCPCYNLQVMQGGVKWIRSPAPPTSARRSRRDVHRDILHSAALQLGDLLASSSDEPPQASAATRSTSPAPYEPSVPMAQPAHRSPEAYGHTKLLTKLELEATALQNQLPNSLVTRAALQDAMRVLDENRALKQQLACAEGMLATHEQQGQAFTEAMARRDHEQGLMVAALQEEVANLQHSQRCLREEVMHEDRPCEQLTT